jgi:hypothetical protein
VITAETITHRQLVALFGDHCECRPFDIDRASHDHSHDCDTDILETIQCALFAADVEERYGARFQCAEILNARKVGA